MRFKILSTGLVAVLLLLVASTAAAGTTVFPSSDLSGVIDQANIKAALDAEKNGGTVELAAGTFYLHKSIVVAEFDGTFKGAGQELTTIHTAPGVNFDLSEGYDYFEPPFGYLGAGMFVFPYSPSAEARDFVMSDMKIVVSEPGVDPPLDGFADFRRSYLLNTMLAIVVVNVDIVAVLNGQPYGTINLNATVEDLEIEGIKHPRFRGYWDEFLIDTDNSIFDGLVIQGPSVGKAEALDVKVVNADIGFALSDNNEALIESSIVQNAIYGIENFFSRTIALNNEFTNVNLLPIFAVWAPGSLLEGNNISGDAAIPILVEQSPETEIRGNNISGDAAIPILVEQSPETEIRGNHITGNYVWGINPYLGSDECGVIDNTLGMTENGEKLGMSSQFGAISVEQSNNCIVSGNKFVNVSSPLLGAVWVSGQFNRVENNDYTESGLPGWNVGPGAIMLARFNGATFNRGSTKNYVLETQFPAGTDVCDQVQGIQGNNVQTLIGGEVGGVNPGMCAAVLTLDVFNESNAGLLQQMAKMQDRREEAWSRSRGAQ